MSDGVDDWVCSSNDALTLQLVRSAEDSKLLAGEELLTVDTFNPTFTYPIFGEEERIFGYKGLEIQLRFASGSLRQYLDISHDEKLASRDTPADDIEQKLFGFIPVDYTKSEETFAETVDRDAAEFKPYGDKIASYVRPAVKGLSKGKGKGKGKANGISGLELKEDDEGAVVYEIYKASWLTPGFREYHRRMQLFILLFIEGGSYVQEDEDAWEFFVLYERRRRPKSDAFSYHFVGYSSVYPFWCYPDQVRLRLSQFVILPPYQHQGHGSQLYSAVYRHALSRPDVAELSVEDPIEDFEDLRDRNDLRYLVDQGLLDDPNLLLDVGSDKRGARVLWEMGLRKKHKIAQRQFDRLLEMLILKKIDRTDPAQIRAYRLHVKGRLYRFNYEQLAQSTPAERKEALAKTYETVLEDYDRLLDMTFH